MAYIKMGPVGSEEEATAFTFLPAEGLGQPRIRAVTVDHDWAIDGLFVQFEDNTGTPSPLASPETPFKNPAVFEVPANDHIIAVYVGHGRQAPGYPDNQVITLQFETFGGNRSQVFGGGSGEKEVTDYVIRAPEGNQVLGLFGARNEQGLLLRLGTHIGPGFLRPTVLMGLKHMMESIMMIGFAWEQQQGADAQKPADYSGRFKEIEMALTSHSQRLAELERRIGRG